jgi:4-hydroxyphenylpyruvate dioxygenase-like putative hemolysin
MVARPVEPALSPFTKGTLVKLRATPMGVYAATFVNVSAHRSCRSLVRITGVIEIATHYTADVLLVRRGYRVGEVLDVETKMLEELATPHILDYLTALKIALQVRQAAHDLNPQSARAWAHAHAIASLNRVIQAEERRLITGEWHFDP